MLTLSGVLDADGVPCVGVMVAVSVAVSVAVLVMVPVGVTVSPGAAASVKADKSLDCEACAAMLADTRPSTIVTESPTNPRAITLKRRITFSPVPLVQNGNLLMQYSPFLSLRNAAIGERPSIS